MSIVVEGSSVATEKATTAMFRGAALEFSRSLRSRCDVDPDFLAHHEVEVCSNLERFLHQAGVCLEEPDARVQLLHVAREVIIRLRSFEKGKE